MSTPRSPALPSEAPQLQRMETSEQALKALLGQLSEMHAQLEYVKLMLTLVRR